MTEQDNTQPTTDATQPSAPAAQPEVEAAGKPVVSPMGNADGHEIAQGDLGKDGRYSVQYKNGMIAIDLGYQGKYAGARIIVNVGLIEALEAAALSTQNKIDDKVVAMVKALL